MPVGSYWPLPVVIARNLAAPAAPDIREDGFLAALQAYLPPGRAWTRDPNAVLTGLLRGLATGWERVHQRARQLLVEAFPSSTMELLGEWEGTLGLPDPCLEPDALPSARRAQVVARLTYSGGQSVPYFLSFAASLGYPGITITEFAPWHVGLRVGLPLRGEAWAYGWEVTAPGFSAYYFRVGIDQAGDRLMTWTQTYLACEMQRIKPGHTILFFHYELTPEMGLGWLTAEDGVTLITDEAGNPMRAL